MKASDLIKRLEAFPDSDVMIGDLSNDNRHYVKAVSRNSGHVTLFFDPPTDQIEEVEDLLIDRVIDATDEVIEKSGVLNEVGVHVNVTLTVDSNATPEEIARAADILRGQK